MESLDDLLDFASDIGEEDDDVENNNNSRTKSLKSAPFSLHSSRGAENSGIVEEEELEWISNKDAFPKFESFVDIIPNNLNNNKFNQSPVSVLENITNNSSSNNNYFKVPVRARSKTRRKKRREQWQDYSGWGTSGNKSNKRSRAGGGAANNKPMESDSSSAVFGRKCQHCQTEKTPQWRAGPTGPKTLCNACGVRYKSGRLVPEYCPASSPTFSTELHSNSHRKVLEMRRQKQMGS